MEAARGRRSPNCWHHSPGQSLQIEGVHVITPQLPVMTAEEEQVIVSPYKAVTNSVERREWDLIAISSSEVQDGPRHFICMNTKLVGVVRDCAFAGRT